MRLNEYSRRRSKRFCNQEIMISCKVVSFLISSHSFVITNNHICSTLFKTQEKESKRTSKGIEKKRITKTHTNETRTCDPKYYNYYNLLYIFQDYIS